jgi:signal transduction histidine kinase
MSSLRLDVQMLRKETAKGKDCIPERVAELSDRACNTMNRMDKVFQEFFYLSSPDAGIREVIDVAGCVHECVEMLAPRFEQGEVNVGVDVPENGLKAVGEPLSFRRALVNVVTNAEQAAGRGGRVEVRAYGAGDKAVVDVTDSGPGVSRGERARIFDMFVSTRPGGTGLGLFLARTAVERCGGTVDVHDAEHGGACFRISVPLAKDV